MPTAEQQQQYQAQQAASLKRKRELEDARTDPAGFSERIFASYLSSASGSGQSSQNSVAVGDSDAITAELLSFLNEDVFKTDCGLDGTPSADTGPQAQIPVNSSIGLNFVLDDSSVNHARWFSDPASVPAETPELSQHDDPTKTSPADMDIIATPSDSSVSLDATKLQNIKDQTQSQYAGHGIGPFARTGTTATTKSIMTSFDQEYERILAGLVDGTNGSSAPTTLSAPTSESGLMNWSWETGPIAPAA